MNYLFKPNECDGLAWDAAFHTCETAVCGSE